MPEFAIADHDPSAIAESFAATRALSEALAAPLSEADATIQSMEDASPTKWHLAHTTWFWETFLLREHAEGYRLYDETFPFLFNSYYEAEGERIARGRRGMLSRPTVTQIREWREHVDEAMQALVGREDLAPLIRLGISHEQQHQELLLTDIKHALWQNPCGVAYRDDAKLTDPDLADQDWQSHPGGIARIGNDGAQGFAFDNEGPVHQHLLQPFALSNRLVTNGEWDAFIADGGYGDHRLWLADGWAWVQDNLIVAPLYWREGEEYTLAGWQPRNPDAPVTHISHYEADAFAEWAGHRLPTEMEWEAIAWQHDASAGNQLDRDGRIPHPSGSGSLFGDCWQFTRSAYLPYPGFRPAEGAVGEYNGKFMSGQGILRGASCATPRGHSRASYRNFFYPHQRWQFTGVRLAKDL